MKIVNFATRRLSDNRGAVVMITSNRPAGVIMEIYDNIDIAIERANEKNKARNIAEGNYESSISTYDNIYDV